MRNTLNFWMCTFMLTAWIALSFAVVYAHGGEDHGEKKPTSTVIQVGYYSAEAISDKYEVLIKYGSLEPGKAAELTLFLSDANSNLPISGAQLKCSNPDDAAQTFLLTPTDSGIYAIHTQFSNGSKPAKIQITIDGALGADLIEVSEIAFGSEKHSVAIGKCPFVATIEKHSGHCFGLDLGFGRGNADQAQAQSSEDCHNCLAVNHIQWQTIYQ